MAGDQLKLKLRFYGVGQGLFSYGEVAHAKSGAAFRWVYDCGTLSSQALLTRAINHLCSHDLTRKPHLDLVAISHFDKDHISGLVELLKRCSVGVLLLPYAQLWKRLLLAFEDEKGLDADFLKFLVHPVRYLANVSDAQIDKIVFVQAGAEDGPLNDREQPEEGSEFNFEVVAREEWNEEWRKDLDGGSSNVQVEVLKKGALLAWHGCWEFVPYNDSDISSKDWQTKKERIESFREQLIEDPDISILNAIKATYDEAFGSNPKARNLISLFLYAGQMPNEKRGFWESFRGHRYNHRLSIDYRSGFFKSGIFYTGDGYLDTAICLQRFKAFMGPRRINRPLAFQVMHHGSSGNWRAGLAKQFRPSISVFSSDPLRGKKPHPHANVVRDFLPYNPVQVDKFHSLEIFACFG